MFAYSTETVSSIHYAHRPSQALSNANNLAQSKQYLPAAASPIMADNIRAKSRFLQQPANKMQRCNLNLTAALFPLRSTEMMRSVSGGKWIVRVIVMTNDDHDDGGRIFADLDMQKKYMSWGSTIEWKIGTAGYWRSRLCAVRFGRFTRAPNDLTCYTK